MKPRKVRLTGKMHQIPPEELRQVVGGKDPGGNLPPGADHAMKNANEHALLNSSWANWSNTVWTNAGSS